MSRLTAFAWFVALAACCSSLPPAPPKAATPNYAYEIDVTAWGWIHLIIGVVVAFAGIAVYSGATWARSVGIVLAILSAIANFLYIPYYPVWAVLIIALNVAVIWALAVYGTEQAQARGA